MSKDLITFGEYHGKLYEDNDSRFASHLYGLENESDDNLGNETPVVIPDSSPDGDNVGGAVFGFVQSGSANVNGRLVSEGCWFSTSDGAVIEAVGDRTRLFAIQRRGWKGWNTQGGPIEARGRLRYIDGCSDSLLVAPIRKGDACLNHLHFPANIDQTHHTHPSIRAGMVAGGAGECRIPNGEGGYTAMDLKPGLIFVIPTDGIHAFATIGSDGMDVIPYHPESDFGPEDEEHPMVNRTLVEGAKLDNSRGRHAEAVLEEVNLGAGT